MPSKSLYNLPGLGAYYAAADRNAEAEARDLQSVLQLAQLSGAMHKLHRQSQIEEMAQLAGGDPEKLFTGYLQAGDADAAAKVAQVAETRRKLQEMDATRSVLRGLSSARSSGGGQVSSGARSPDAMSAGAPPMPVGGDTGDPYQSGPTLEAAGRMDATGVNPLTAPPAPRPSYTAEQVASGRSAAIQSRIDYLNQAAEQLEAAGVVEGAEKYRNKALEYSKLLPTYHATEREAILPGGRRGVVKINTFGEETPAGFTPAPKQDELDGLLTNLGIDRSNPLYRQLMMSRATKLATHQPAASQQVYVNTEKQLLGNIAEGVGKDVTAALGSARGAAQTLNTLGQIRGALDSGRVIAGPGATARQWLGQVGQVMGVNGRDANEQLTQTRSVIQGLAQLELDAAQQMKGQGQITEAERAIIRRAASGDIESMTIPELRTLMGAMDRTARYKIGINAANVQRLRNNPNAASLVDFMNIETPQPYQPATGTAPGVEDLLRKYGGRR